MTKQILLIQPYTKEAYDVMNRYTAILQKSKLMYMEHKSSHIGWLDKIYCSTQLTKNNIYKLIY